jgi:hypothetical protein
MEIGGCFKFNLLPDAYGEQNAASGSWRMIKVCLVFRPNRQHLKYPPTAVGGIRIRNQSFLCRSSVNNPPIAIGGIRDQSSPFFSSPLGGSCGTSR